MAVIAKGDASIIINAQETEAKLLFVPDPEGLGWDMDALIKLAGDNRLSPPPSPKILEPFLQKAVRAKEPMELVLYEGLLPEEPVAESVSWESLPIPEDIAPFKDEVLSGAAPPQLYRVKIEKVKRETVVKKPNKLPFLPPKEEVIVSWDKKETREAVEVDPAVLEIRYAEKNKKLGTLFPPKPGKPGKNILGRPIPPQNRGDMQFLLGPNLAREKNELRSLCGGFVRIGANWADLIPLAKPSWTLAPGSDGVTLFFSFEPGDRRFPIPTGAEILASVNGEPSALVKAEELDKAIGTAVRNNEVLLAFPVFHTREAEARVIVSPDQTKAELYLRKGVAGALPLEMKAISQVLKDSRVQGFDVEKLRTAIRSFMEGRELELRCLLVEGKPSTRGQDKEVKLLISPLPEAERELLLGRLKDSGGVSGAFRPGEASAVAVVRKGERIARIETSADGEPGKDIFGNVLPGLPGNDPELKLFQGLRLHGQDILAEEGGLLLVKGSEKCFWGQILDYRDASVAVRVAEDAMEASVDLVKERGAGKALRKEDIVKALADAGVCKGIDPAAVEAAHRLAAAKGSCTAVLARGRAPLAKGASALTWLIPVKQDAAGNMEAGQSVSVTQGTALAEIRSLGDAGRAGFDVRGTALDPQQGQALAVEHDDSIAETPMDQGKRLSAARSGVLGYNGKILSISTMRGIKGDVGPATGNINFSGELRITGKVNSGFTVMGGSNVLIGGSAEGALISAGGRAVIAQGIAGGGKGVVRARNTIEAAFAEQATLMAVEDIKVKGNCTGCNIKTNGKLLLGETGRLAGGICKARFGVYAAEIGSDKGNRTEISFGQDYLVKDQIEAVEREIERLRFALAETEKKIKQAEKIPPALEAARGEKVTLMKLLEQANLKVFTLREKFEEHFESEIRILSVVYPGVVMESHDRYYEVTQKRSRVIFYFDRESGRIKDRSPEG